jgi:hypothetical protein
VRAFRPCFVLGAVFIASLAAGLPAQELLAPPPDLNLDELGELPRSLVAPNSGLGLPQSVTRGQAEEIMLGPEFGPEMEPMPDESLLIYDPAEVWSSRSWLDRGYWYTVQEATITVRTWDKQGTLLALTNPAVANRRLEIRSGHPAAVANARLTLGRFLFRDTENRDHLFETTFYGFGNEQQRGSVQSVTPDSLFTPFRVSNGSPAFSQSSAQAYVYTHEFESLEFNYRVRQRMDRDWMTLRPNGQWVREVSPGTLFEYMGGIRWMSADEWLDWDATGDTNGSMAVKANNDLLGLQLGGGFSHSFARWEASFRGKAGVYGNLARVNRSFVVRDGAMVVSSDSGRAEEEDISFLGEFQAVMRYHIHQNFSFRFGYQLMYLDSMAIAPFNISFEPGYRQVGLSGSSLYQGFLLGIDGYW